MFSKIRFGVKAQDDVAACGSVIRRVETEMSIAILHVCVFEFYRQYDTPKTTWPTHCSAVPP